MTTITLENNIKLQKTVFKDEKEMIIYFIEHTNYNYLDFYELDKNEISASLLDKINISKKKSISEFDNI